MATERALPDGGEVTRLLDAAGGGDRNALDRLYPLVYHELRDVASRQLRREQAGHTLHPTALVHEAYLKLAGGPPAAANRGHFLALAARAMRQILVDHARRRGAEKGGKGWRTTTLTDGAATLELDPAELVALDRAMGALDERQRQVVECRFFGGMEDREISEALGVSERTVRRDWVKARAWLYREIYPEN
jgi:RNA polymerase sigma-70 factor, ECF subfamily